ncbi:MAG TPA: threo-3-hydroxy-L-aspartate ammonia-lyase [Piscinibacter sp.]|jgi:threonine dehydratase|uniref:threo-3-hydroxy-L-aspartate ammonia-lyase n=1 Tax=Piscinibacter sp. TaxID=1903157 RepID=UPI001B6D8D5F|nr:threo-3-hydroxy-L-aspartate ammonia-lyase [Piscinibacter sp.]MBK7531309.1 threo-3-hydroxy-L-aspartate ammonia-lyase [Piscinibacter sp.]MBP6542908.1 threo-3-hydroxy-L-aspartate ammonia-lyase [Piscinibacter sp.]HPG79761.1 threo-3-hydroxy-L-aspartate ammonia-lyase [Piscinibacter sp.]HPM66520.1 threo-3-hydroxy-L-aspartate ammonia-lyase [Piscinibacter sp.]
MLQFTEIEAAAARLKGVAHRTPVVSSRTLDELLGMQVLMKAENLQRMGAFKFRGGYNSVNVLSDEERSRGVVAFSSGNHAQAVALAARLHGCAATIVMPHDAPALKLAATRGYGAEVIVYDRYKEDRAEIATRLTQERGASLIPPYDHLPVMAGQGTAALELIEDAGPLDALIVCAGGGGFLSGCAVAAKHLLPGIAVFGAEPERGNDMQQSLRSGQLVHIDVPRTICDGQQTQSPGKHPFEVIRALVTDVLTVPDPVVVEAMRFVFERMKLVLEPSGACALAALMHHRDRFRGQRVGVTLSGGNIGIDRFVALVTGAERVD